jgi:hypothetical protein
MIWLKNIVLWNHKKYYDHLERLWVIYLNKNCSVVIVESIYVEFCEQMLYMLPFPHTWE